jgi:hypothetical protein
MRSGVRSALRAAAWISEMLGKGWLVSRRTARGDADRQRGLLIQLPSLGTERVRTGRALAVAEQGQEAAHM